MQTDFASFSAYHSGLLTPERPLIKFAVEVVTAIEVLQPEANPMDEMTTTQAVRAYKTHPNVLNRLILMGRLQARKDADGHWLIRKESLEHWNSQRVLRGPKRPTAKQLKFKFDDEPP